MGGLYAYIKIWLPKCVLRGSSKRALSGHTDSDAHKEFFVSFDLIVNLPRTIIVYIVLSKSGVKGCVSRLLNLRNFRNVFRKAFKGTF